MPRTVPLVEAALLLAVLFVGTDFVAVKYALVGFPPLVLAGLRFAAAGLLLCGLLRFIEPGGAPGRTDLYLVLGLGLVGVTLNQIGYTVGLGLTSGSNAALMFATAPAWGLILGVALRLERASVRGMLGLGIALLGVTLVVYEGLGADEASLGGDLLVLLSAACWGGYTVLSLPVLGRLSPLTVAAYSMLIGGLVLLALSSPDLFSVDWGDVGTGAWAGALYSTLFASAFAIAAWQTGVSRIGANRVLVYMYLITLVGVFSSALLLGDSLGPLKLLGGAVILSGVYLVRRAKPLSTSSSDAFADRPNKGGGS